MLASVVGTTAALVYITGTLLNPFFITFIVVSTTICVMVASNGFQVLLHRLVGN